MHYFFKDYVILTLCCKHLERALVYDLSNYLWWTDWIIRVVKGPVIKNQHVTWIVCWQDEVAIRLTASKSPSCHPSTDPLRNLFASQITSDDLYYNHAKHNITNRNLEQTRFARGERPNCLGADLPDRPSPLQLLWVGTRWCLARRSHRLTTEHWM